MVANRDARKAVGRSQAYSDMFDGNSGAIMEFEMGTVAQQTHANETAKKFMSRESDMVTTYSQLVADHEETVNALAMPVDENFIKQDEDHIRKVWKQFEDSVSKLKADMANYISLLDKQDKFYDESGWVHCKQRLALSRSEVEKCRNASNAFYKQADDTRKWRDQFKDDSWGSTAHAPMLPIDSEEATRAVSELPLFHFNDFPHDGRWGPLKAFSGGQANAALWAKIDGNDDIEAMIVRKDDTFKYNDVINKARWIRHDAAKYGREPLETYCHDKVQNAQGARNIVRYIGHEIDWRRFQYRIYTEFCRFGSLQDWVDSYVDTAFPVDWLWMVFEKLVNCGLVMEKGSVDKPPTHGWTQIVHRDLKPMNVFVNDSREDWPGFVQPMLGDFGFAFMAKPNDQWNPINYAGAGTPGYCAPEQLSHVPGEVQISDDKFRLLAHTNVWGIGAIMMALMDRGYEEKQRQPWFIAGADREYRLSAGCTSDFGTLAVLVQRCLRWQPWLRPTFTELRTEIDRHISRSEDLSRDRAGVEGKHTTANSWPANDGMEGYKIGMAYTGPEWGEQEASWPATDEDPHQPRSSARQGARRSCRSSISMRDA